MASVSRPSASSTTATGIAALGLRAEDVDLREPALGHR